MTRAASNPHPERLDQEDPYLTRFEATVVTCEVAADGRSATVTLDRTAFYPESGGQPADRGRLGVWPVLDVVEDEVTGRVLHLLGPTPDGFPVPGERLVGEIDPARRRDHRQQHAGQHVLSAAFEKLLGASTVGFHVGEEVVTIDLDRPAVTADDLHRVEDLANSVVLDDREIIAHRMTLDEVSRLPLRKPPTRREGIRVIEIRDFDWSPCGGTHPARTGEIGPIKIVGLDRVRGNPRIVFLCGGRAIRDYRLKDDVVRGLAATLSVPPAAVPEAVRRLSEQARRVGKELVEARAALIEYEADAFRREAGPDALVVKRFEGRPMSEIKLLGARLAARPRTVAILATSDESGAQVVMTRSADLASVDLRSVIQDLLPLIRGRGGGSPAAVQGGGPVIDGLDELLKRAATAVGGMIDRVQ